MRIVSRREAQDAKACGDLRLVQSFLGINFATFRDPESVLGPVVLICDIENTLTPRGSGELSEAVLTKFGQARQVGFRYVVLRTNKKRKRKRFSNVGSGDFTIMATQLEAIFGAGNVLLRQPQRTFWPLWAAGKWPRKPWWSAFEQDLVDISEVEFADKDIRFGNRRICTNRVVVVGDKFRFDVLRPLIRECMAILVNPIGDDGRGDKLVLIRPLERFTLWRLGLHRPHPARN